MSDTFEKRQKRSTNRYSQCLSFNYINSKLSMDALFHQEIFIQ